MLDSDIDPSICGCLGIPISGAKALVVAALTSMRSLQRTRRARRQVSNIAHFDESPLNRLLSLPTEILHLIVDQLNLIDAVCLSLTCQRLHTRLENHRYILQKLSKGHKFDLHFRITQHLPGVFFCYQCFKLHDVRQVGSPGPLFYRPRGAPLDCLGRVHRAVEWPLYDLNFRHIQLAMQNHRNPRTGLPVDSLFFRQVIENIKRKDSDFRPETVLISVEPRIIDGRLFMRRQHWELYRRVDVLRNRRQGCVRRRFHIEALIRQKYSTSCSDNPCLPQMEIEMMLAWALGETPLDASKVTVVHRRCGICGVECEWSTHLYDHESIALITTRWMPFGDGRSPYPVLRFGEAGYPWFDRTPGKHEYDGPDSKATYEAEGPQLPLAELIMENERCLRGLEYKRAPFVRMYHLSGSCRSWVEQIDVKNRRKQRLSLFLHT